MAIEDYVPLLLSKAVGAVAALQKKEERRSSRTLTGAFLGFPKLMRLGHAVQGCGDADAKVEECHCRRKT